jgi:hypothetical protein
MYREFIEVLQNLCGEFTRWGKHKRSRGTARASDKLVQYRQQEGSSFAASSHGAGEHIPSGDGGGDGVELYWSGANEAEFLNAPEKVWVQLQ